MVADYFSDDEDDDVVVADAPAGQQAPDAPSAQGGTPTPTPTPTPEPTPTAGDPPAEPAKTPEGTPPAGGDGDAVDWTLPEPTGSDAGDAPAPAVNQLPEVATALGMDWVPETTQELRDAYETHFNERVQQEVQILASQSVLARNAQLNLPDDELVRENLIQIREQMKATSPHLGAMTDEQIDAQVDQMAQAGTLKATADTVRHTIAESIRVDVEQQRAAQAEARRQQMEAQRQSVEAQRQSVAISTAAAKTLKTPDGEFYPDAIQNLMVQRINSDEYSRLLFEVGPPHIAAISDKNARDIALHQWHMNLYAQLDPSLAPKYQKAQERGRKLQAGTVLATTLQSESAPTPLGASVPTPAVESSEEDFEPDFI